MTKDWFTLEQFEQFRCKLFSYMHSDGSRNIGNCNEENHGTGDDDHESIIESPEFICFGISVDGANESDGNCILDLHAELNDGGCLGEDQSKGGNEDTMDVYSGVGLEDEIEFVLIKGMALLIIKSIMKLMLTTLDAIIIYKILINSMKMICNMRFKLKMESLNAVKNGMILITMCLTIGIFKDFVVQGLGELDRDISMEVRRLSLRGNNGCMDTPKPEMVANQDANVLNVNKCGKSDGLGHNKHTCQNTAQAPAEDPTQTLVQESALASALSEQAQIQENGQPNIPASEVSCNDQSNIPTNEASSHADQMQPANDQNQLNNPNLPKKARKPHKCGFCGELGHN